jgi:putative endonuclease
MPDHNPGYTSSRRPVDRITDRIAAERQIKGWSRAKKEALIRADWKKLTDLSRRRAGKARDN